MAWRAHWTGHVVRSGRLPDQVQLEFFAGPAGTSSCRERARCLRTRRRAGGNRHRAQHVAYDPASNHDPDADSNGTTITVSKKMMSAVVPFQGGGHEGLEDDPCCRFV